MKWTEDEARELGLKVNISRYAIFRENEAIHLRGHGMVIDLLEGKPVANSVSDNRRVEALDLLQFETLKELVVWLKLQR